MKFTFTPLKIPEVVLIEHESFADARGFFAETLRTDQFAAAGLPTAWIQENHSRSARGVLRGLHYQNPPRAQAKLVVCVRGRIFDVAVDVRKGSPAYGRWVSAELSDENRRMLYVPPGFAHGFLALTDGCDVIYKQTDYWAPKEERGIRWDDPELGIDWPLLSPIVSPRDAAHPSLKAADNRFSFPANA